MFIKWQGATAIAVPRRSEGLGQALLALQFLLSQAALVSLVFGLWRLGVDLNITGQFILDQGLLSHWQVWFALSALFYAASTAVPPPRPDAGN